MGTYRITCVNKDDRQNPYERIKYVGLYGEPGKFTQQQIVKWIDSNQHRFYVLQGGRSVNVVTATSRFGHRYIKTETDYQEQNNLLLLPECVN